MTAPFGIPAYQDRHVAKVDKDGRRKLYTLIDLRDGRGPRVLVHPDHWDDFVRELRALPALDARPQENAMPRETHAPIVFDATSEAAVIRAFARLNCLGTLELQAERVAHFARRIEERGDNPRDVVITLINVDEPSGVGAGLAAALMPGHDWQAYRDQGAVPFARGLAKRVGLEEMLDELDPEVAAEMRAINGVAVLVVDHGAVAAFPARIAVEAVEALKR